MLLPLRLTINLSSSRFMGRFLSQLKLVFWQLPRFGDYRVAGAKGGLIRGCR
jgi:hypothetical protein